MPFPTCVFLPNGWGLACASCIVCGPAVKCLSSIIRNEYLDSWWKINVVPFDNGHATRWFERGHRLSKSRPGSRPIIWTCHLDKGSGPARDMARSFVYPPEVLDAMILPGYHWIPDRTSTYKEYQ